MTKKLLLGSTALVGAFALAAPAFADIEVTLSGQVEFGASAADEETIDDGRGYFFFMDSETKIEAEGAADNGVNYSAKVELETDADGDGGDVNADETRIALWGGFGRVELGREDGAADNMFVAGEDFQAGTGGIDGDPANLDFPGVNDSGDAAKITYFTPRVGGFQVGASFTPDTGDGEDDSDDDAGDIEEHVELGANFTGAFGGADVTLTAVASIGDAEVGDDDLEDWGIGGGVEFGGLGIGAGYTVQEDLDEGDGFTVGAKYGFGPANVSAGYSYDNPDAGDETGVFVVSGDYGLWPGVTLKGDIAFNDDDDDTGADDDSTTAGVVTLQLDY
ncbi:MAG: porin [Alphaproteobacteria bacterium]|nr:porin [Alphaproteobacteria bacterium]